RRVEVLGQLRDLSVREADDPAVAVVVAPAVLEAVRAARLDDDVVAVGEHAGRGRPERAVGALEQRPQHLPEEGRLVAVGAREGRGSDDGPDDVVGEELDEIIEISDRARHALLVLVHALHVARARGPRLEKTAIIVAWSSRSRRGCAASCAAST